MPYNVTLECFGCSMSFNSWPIFKLHLKDVHKLTEEDKKTQGEHVEVQNPDSIENIMISSVRSQNSEYLKRTNPFQYNFKNPESIEMIKQGQKEAKPYHCKFCQKSFAWKSQKISHERIHTGEKPFQCQFCHKYFARNYTKICHERIHTGDRPFRCQICRRSFFQRNSLTLHQKTHTGEKTSSMPNLP